jgi:hypothetical protein
MNSLHGSWCQKPTIFSGPAPTCGQYPERSRKPSLTGCSRRASLRISATGFCRPICTSLIVCSAPNSWPGILHGPFVAFPPVANQQVTRLRRKRQNPSEIVAAAGTPRPYEEAKGIKCGRQRRRKLCLVSPKTARFGSSVPSSAWLQWPLAGRRRDDLPLPDPVRSAILVSKPPGIWRMSARLAYR